MYGNNIKGDEGTNNSTSKLVPGENNIIICNIEDFFFLCSNWHTVSGRIE